MPVVVNTSQAGWLRCRLGYEPFKMTTWREREKRIVFIIAFTILVILFLDSLDELEGEFVGELVEESVEELEEE